MKSLRLAIICGCSLFTIHAYTQGYVVGGMGGAFSVSPLGGATYTVPIDVPLGVGGLQPQLSIVYNSQSGNGLCGYGASLAGLSSITRGPKDIYHDGTAKGIEYLADDALYLDGVRLILQSGTAGQEGAVYCLESDPFTTVTVNGDCSSTSNNIWYEVKGGNGMVSWYGKNIDSRLSYTVDGSQRIHSWNLCYVSQPTGNYINYYYERYGNTLVPSMIMYGGNSGDFNSLSNIIEFTYETRSDSIPVFFDGQKGFLNRRLKYVTGKTNDNVYRRYTLNYNTASDGTAFKFSRLTGITESNAQGETLPPISLGWSFLPQIDYSSSSLIVTQNWWRCLTCGTTAATYPVECELCGGTDFEQIAPPSGSTIPFTDQAFSCGDMNNDGIMDIIGISSSSNSTLANIYYGFRNNSGILFSKSDDSFCLPSEEPFICFETYRNGNFISDLNGDGTNELIVPYFDGVQGDYGETTIYIMGEDFSCEAKEQMLERPSIPLISTGDLYNDGKSRVVILETGPYIQGYALHIFKYNDQFEHGVNDVLVYSSLQHLSFSSKPRQMYLSDMNGDGLQDLFVLCNDGYKIFFNQGNSIFPESTSVTGNSLSFRAYNSAGDFNGDGLLDVITKETPSQWYIYQNNGNGSFSKMSVFTDNVLSACSLEKFHCDVLDFDGDGRSDIIITENISIPPILYSDITRTIWLRSNGFQLTKVYEAISNRADDALAKRFITGDFDGDGRTELVNYGYDCVNGTNSNSNPVWRIYKNSNLTAQSGKVTSITGDYGATTSITYSTLTDPSVYTRGGNDPYPAPRYTIPLNVVRLTTQNNGAAGLLTTLYTYEGLKAHLRGRGLLGFSKMAANCTTTGLISESGVTQWNTAFYIPKVTYSKTTVGSSYALATSTLTIVDKGLKRYFAYPSQTVETDMDGNSVTTTRGYDHTNGYPTVVNTSYGTGMYRTVSYGNYVQTTAGVYLPGMITTTQKHADDNTVFSTTDTCSYDMNTGAVLKRVQNVGTSKPLTTSYNYDVWGNLISKVSTGRGISNHCTTLYDYDATRRFPVRVYTSPASSVQKYTYDLWGNVLSEQDSINSTVHNTTTYSYDSWGNLTGTVRPDGTTTASMRGWNNSASQRYFLLTQGTATPWVKTWYDNQGREVKTESIGPNDADITTTTVYDAKGQVEERTETSGDLTLTYTYTYDPRGRIASETGPGGRSVTYQYGNRSVTVTENSSRITVKTYDAWGNLKTLTDPVSGITNTYSSTGGIKQTSSGGATWTFGYDNRGNRTSMTDPDAGTTTYVYDALGRETQRTDARGVAFVTTYDYLGRVTRRKADSETVTYSYGSAGNGQLKLASESYDGWTMSYTYDSLGRVTGETMSNGTITKSRSYTYGPDGMLATRTLPGGKTYSYSYDSYGNLTGVDAASGALRWDLTGYTGKRTTSTTVLGNSSYYTFNKATVLDQYGYLDSLITDKNGIRYQDYDYGFSPLTGNLTRLDANWMDYPRTFQYDSTDRLIRVQENNQDILYMTYAQNGNILSKSGIGYYEYGSTQKPHAVTAVDNFDGWIDDSIQYISYNSWGKLEDLFSVRDGDVYHYSIEYGPDLQRVRSSLYRNGQPLYSKLYWDDYEEKTENNTTYLYWYVNGGEGLAGIMLGNAQNGSWSLNLVAITDHLGSIMALMDNYDTYYSCSYDAWGNRTIGMESPWGIDRGFCGHEHIDEIGLIDMNGRMYDPKLGRFLSPDPYVQSPTNPQNYNRYSYCLNNPLKYTDPDGEFWHIVIGAAVGGVINLAVNWNNCDGFWEYVAAFGVGAGSGALTAATGGASAGLAIGAAAIGGAATSATNNLIAQTGNNFSGSIDWGQVGYYGLVGAVAGTASYGASSWAISNLSSPIINSLNINSPVLAQGINGTIGGAAGGFAGGFAGGYLMSGFDVNAGWDAAISGLKTGAAMGGSLGAAGGYVYAKQNDLNPWTGKISKPLYHYTTPENANKIMKSQLGREKDSWVYLTPDGTKTPLQAQIELALPQNNNGGAIIEVRPNTLYPKDFLIQRNVTGNVYNRGGGGYEMIYNGWISKDNIFRIK